MKMNVKIHNIILRILDLTKEIFEEFMNDLKQCRNLKKLDLNFRGL